MIIMDVQHVNVQNHAKTSNVQWVRIVRLQLMPNVTTVICAHRNQCANQILSIQILVKLGFHWLIMLQASSCTVIKVITLKFLSYLNLIKVSL